MGAPAGRADDDLVALEDLLGPRGARRKRRHQPEEASAGQDAAAPADAGPRKDTDAPGEDPPAGPGRADAPAAPGRADGPSSAAADRPVGPASAASGRADAPPSAPRQPGPASTAVRGAGEAATASRRAVIEAERLPAIPTLMPLEPSMGLAEQLRRNRFVTVPARGGPRVAAIAAAALFGVLWVLSLRGEALGRPWPLNPAVLFILFAASAGAYFAVARVWPERELRLPLAPTQEQQFERIEEHVTWARRMMAGGVAGAALGLLLLATTFGAVPRGGWPIGLALGSLLLAGGIVAAVAGIARWMPLRLLYVQTLVLQRLEGMGIGQGLSLDPRTADVLMALDRLLGELPESSLRQFLSRPEAEWYLDLIHKVKGGRGGR